MLKKTICISVILLLAACGSDDESNAIQGLENVTDVSGHYSMITSALSAECTDGTSDTFPALALSGTITHTGNNVLFTNDNAGGNTPGITILEQDDMDGVIESSGRFVMTSTATIQIDGVSGDNTASYNLSGYFNDSGWSGDYVYSLYFQSIGGSCEYSTTFSGSKD
jgi:hypothetical protein